MEWGLGVLMMEDVCLRYEDVGGVRDRRKLPENWPENSPKLLPSCCHGGGERGDRK